MTTELNDKERAVIILLSPHETDVGIAAMFEIVYKDEGLSNSAMQRRLGMFITRLNRKLETSRQRIKPGIIKRTYRLTSAV